jgi:TolA-binding protein
MSSTDPRTRAELEDELARMDAQIAELRGARAHLTYDLEWKIKDRDRIQRHVDSLDREEGAA